MTTRSRCRERSFMRPMCLLVALVLSGTLLLKLTPSLLNSPEVRFVCEDVRSGVDEGQSHPGREHGEGRFGVAT
jgi:hypothetical protein